MNTTLQQLNNSQFEAQVLKSKLPVLVDFWATWCGPCRAQSLILEHFARDLQGKINVVKINVDDEPQLAVQYDIMSIPTLMIFDRGQPLARLVGVRTQDELYRAFQQLKLI